MMVSYLNKGADAVCWYSATDGFKSGITDGAQKHLGIINDNFLQYALTNTVYPSDDTSYTSPALLYISRVVANFKDGLDPNLFVRKYVHVNQFVQSGTHYQFAGDGTLDHQNLMDAQMLAILPYQVNAHKWVIPIYVITANANQPFTPENYEIILRGPASANANVTVYDPINDVSVPSTMSKLNVDQIKVKMQVADYPYLLILTD